MSNFAQVESKARSQIGYHEGRSNGSWNNDQKYSKELPGFGWSNHQAWCATFVCWVFWKVGLLGLLPTPSASCDLLASGFKKQGRWSEYPAKGAVVFYGTPSDLNHTGIVVDYDGEYIYTVEGNTNDSGSREGDGVYLKKRARRGVNVIGYGLPKYPEGIESADPKFAKEKPVDQNWEPAVSVSLSTAQAASKVASWGRGLYSAKSKRVVSIIKAALKAEGVATYRDWQIKRKVTPTGVPDAKSLKALGARNGFSVTK